MNKEALVFARHNRYRQVWRNLSQRNPMMAHLYAFSVSRLLKATYHHQRRDVDRNKAIDDNSKNSGTEEKRQSPTYYLENRIM